MNEKEFLIGRVLETFNYQYGRVVEVGDCEIFSIPAGKLNDCGYEVTIKDSLNPLRFRYYVKFGNRDQDTQIRLEVSGAGQNNKLGDEVYVMYGVVDNRWREEGYRFMLIERTDVPSNAITGEGGKPLMTEDGYFIVTEPE